MNNFFCLLLLLAFSLNAAAQSKPTARSKTPVKQPVAKAAPAPGRIHGIGKFKVGETTLSVISELEAEMGTQVKTALTSDDVYQESGHQNVILELKPDTVNQYDGPVQASQCMAAKVYFIPRYKLAEVELNDVQLVFVSGKLAKFQCADPTDLVDALEIKFGKSPVHLTEKTIYCTLQLTGQRVPHKESVYTQSWGNALIPADYVLSVYYNSDCEKKSISYFSITNEAVMSRVEKCEESSTYRRQAALKAAKRKKLSDL